MTGADLIARARSAKTDGVVYTLGEGGLHPEDAGPTRTGKCDCSGWIAWVLNRSRKPTKAWPWWLSTTSVWEDAGGKQVLFRKLERPQAGCLAVYPDHDGHQGHIALVTDVDKKLILDCSGSRNRISEHDGSYFWKNPKVIFCEYIG